MGMIGYFFRADDETIQKIQDGSTADVVFKEELEEQLLDIDKTWHAIHFIVTGNPDECEDGNILSHLIFGSAPVNDDDLGYGPAMLVEKGTVAQIANALNEWGKETFHEKFNMESLIENEIYPVMEGEDAEEFFTYVWEYFVFLKEFYQEAAKEGQHVLTFIA